MDILIAEPERAERVRKNTALMKKGLDEIGYQTGEADAAIVPVIILSRDAHRNTFKQSARNLSAGWS